MGVVVAGLAPPPPGGLALAHQFPAVFGPPAFTGVPYQQPVMPILPALPPPGPVARAAYMPAFFAPGKRVFPTITQPIQPIVPWRVWGPPRLAHTFQYLFRPATKVPPVAPAVPGVGAFGEAMFELALEPGTKVTFNWPTSIFRTYSGREQRQCFTDRPRLSFEGAAFLRDGGSRDIRGALMRAAARGATYVLALPYEEMSIATDSVGTTIDVGSTARCDWALPGQRCVVVSRDNATRLQAIVQSSTSTTITVAIVDSTGHVTSSTLGAAGLAGGRVMPLLQVLLDPQQGFSRYPVGVDLWSIRARAELFGWAGADSMGVGTSIVTYTAAVPVPVPSLVANDLLIWDRPNAIESTSSDSMVNGAEVVDLGGVPFALGGAIAPDWIRPIRLASAAADDWAWLKAFLRHLHGRQGAFLLPTNRPDLVFDSFTPSAQLKIKSASTVGGGDYVSWFASQAQRRLAVQTSDGAIAYTLVLTAVDNGDGTTTLTLQPPVGGTITKISFLEQVRIDGNDSDDIAVTWESGWFSIDLTARATQEVLDPPLPRLFDKVISMPFFYPPLPFPAGPATGTGALGAITLVEFTSDRSQTLTGFRADGGNVDGQVICIVDMNSITAGMTLTHEDATATPGDRFNLANRTGFGSKNAAIWFRYNGAAQRWIEILTT